MANEREGREDRRDRKDSVETVLKALGSAPVPEGLEGRIAARLEQQALGSVRAGFRWREVLGGGTMAGAWWRGAVSGAAVATLAVGVVMLAGHFGRGVSRSGEKVAHGVAQPIAPANGTVRQVASREDRQDRRVPCVGSGVLQVQRGSSAQRPDWLRVEIAGRAQLPKEPALTAEERSLVRVVQGGNLRELASLNPEVRERVEAEDAAQFQRFFTQPVRPVVVDGVPVDPSKTEQVVKPVAVVVEPTAVETPEEPVAPTASSAGENQ
jgi:hypothetical protein